MPNTAHAEKIDSYQDSHLSTAEVYLNAIRQNSSIINRVIAEYGDVTLKNYIKELYRERNLGRPFRQRLGWHQIPLFFFVYHDDWGSNRCPIKQGLGIIVRQTDTPLRPH